MGDRVGHKATVDGGQATVAEAPAGAARDAELAGTDVDAQPGHGTESFFIIGEGLLSESRGGRDESVPAAEGHLVASAAAAGAVATPPFRFSRIGPRGRPPTRAIRRRVAVAMTAGGREDSDMPAGYTTPIRGSSSTTT